MTFWRLYYHLVWGTKDKLPLLDEALEARLYPYLIRKAGSLGCHVFAINGDCDHLHMVISIPPRLSVAEVVKSLKGSSSHDLEGLHWQRGYGVLTVGEKHRSIAIDYVNNQKNHHRQQTVIPWLEHCDDVEESPSSRDARAVRENGIEYDTMGESPF